MLCARVCSSDSTGASRCMHACVCVCVYVSVSVCVCVYHMRSHISFSSISGRCLSVLRGEVDTQTAEHLVGTACRIAGPVAIFFRQAEQLCFAGAWSPAAYAGCAAAAWRVALEARVVAATSFSSGEGPRARSEFARKSLLPIGCSSLAMRFASSAFTRFDLCTSSSNVRDKSH